MTFVKQDEINELRRRTSIVEVISSYIPLTQRGKNYFGVCPFHEDHSPSMSVSEEKQMYKCFSCGAAGNVFTFLENFLNISFGEALSLLAEKTGFSLSQDVSNFKKEESYKEEHEILDYALKFYQNNLNSKEGEDALDYLEKRGLGKDAVKTFEIGLATDDAFLYPILKNKNKDDKMLMDIGLINKVGDNLTDVFKNRILFPLYNLEGKVVGFSGRIYKTDATPKYLNTKETYLFKKGNTLFNYHRAVNEIRVKKEAILVEGYMDCIRLYINGVKNVLAIMGTSLTNEQVTILKKLHSKVILMLDNDEAGEKATFNIASILEEKNINFKIVRLHGKKDPDEYILENGVESILENIKNASSFMDFKLNYFKQNKNLNEASDLAEYIKLVLESLKTSDDALLKEVTLQKLANDYNISYAVLESEMGNFKKIVKEKEEPLKEDVKKLTNYQKICSKILYYMMNDSEYITIFKKQIGFFEVKEYRMIANEIIYFWEKNKFINLADFITYIETTSLKNEVIEIINRESEEVLSEEGFIEILELLKRIIKKDNIKKLKKEIKEETDMAVKEKLISKLTELKKGSVLDESN